jgi:hypothetical protein
MKGECFAMSRQVAKSILDVIVRHSAEQNALWMSISYKCTEEEFGQYRRMIGRSMGTMFVEIVSPIIERYPDLAPPIC